MIHPSSDPTPDIASSTDDYATRFEGRAGEWFLEVQQDATLDFVDRDLGETVLDVGGGHAQNVSGLLEGGFALTVTGSSDSCSHRLKNELSNQRLSFERCPMLALPHGDGSQDFVISYRMLSHLEDWQDLVVELCRVAKHRVIVDYPTIRSFNILGSLLFKLKKGVEKNTRDYLIFQEEEVIQAFEKEGFRMLKRRGQFFFPMALHRMHGNRTLANLMERVSRLLGLNALFGSPVIACFERINYENSD